MTAWRVGATALFVLSMASCKGKTEPSSSVPPPPASSPAPVASASATVDAGDRETIEALGLPPPSHVEAPPAAQPARMALGSEHACAITDDRKVRCWGANFWGQRGDKELTKDRAAPAVVAGVDNAVEIAAGERHTCVRKGDGSIWCWGASQSGQLGVDGAEMQRFPPTRVEGISDVTQLACGNFHTCARRKDGTVSCWGSNFESELGDGTKRNRPTPAPVGGVTGATHIVAARRKTCAVVGGGGVMCWGDGSTPVAQPPWRVDGVSGAVTLASDGFTECAVTANRMVACWGFPFGSDSARGSKESPVVRHIKALEGVVRVALGSGFGCALLGNGGVRCWGANEHGMLGNGTRDRGGPTAIPELADVVEVAASGEHACARKRDGKMLCWGANSHGVLGHATTSTCSYRGGPVSDAPTPQPMPCALAPQAVE